MWRADLGPLILFSFLFLGRQEQTSVHPNTDSHNGPKKIPASSTAWWISVLLRVHTGARVRESQADSKSPPQHGRWSAKAASLKLPPQSNSHTLGVLKIVRSLGRLACSQEEEGRREEVPELEAEGLESFLLPFWEGTPMAPILWGFVQVTPCTLISGGA